MTFRFLGCLTLALLGMAAAPARADEVRYTFEGPGKDWTQPAFDDHQWKTAANLPALAADWRGTGGPSVWVCLIQEMTWQQTNNSYFRAAQDTPMEIFVNGKFLASVKKTAPGTRDYPVTAQRGEVVGRNVYGLHLTAGTGESAVHVEHIVGPWVPVEERVAICYGGHNGFFVDKDGQLRATVWRLPGADLQITLPRIEMTPDGLLRPVQADCLSPTPAEPTAQTTVPPPHE